MPIDKTFSDADIIRIYNNNLTGHEQEKVLEALCDGKEEEENEQKKQEIEEAKNEIELTIEPDVGVWGWVVAGVTALIDREEEQRKEKEEKSKIDLESFNESMLIFIDNMKQYQPPHGRNRKQYNQYLEDIKIKADILSPCNEISDIYIELKDKYMELRELNESLMDGINALTSSIDDWFGF